VWAVIEVVTSTLNPIISTCVLNQFRGNWLLSNTLTITITLIMNMEVELLEMASLFELFDPFEA
jgi:hypothetical protein